jgi:hypothetical protein
MPPVSPARELEDLAQSDTEAHTGGDPVSIAAFAAALTAVKEAHAEELDRMRHDNTETLDRLLTLREDEKIRADRVQIALDELRQAEAAWWMMSRWRRLWSAWWGR